MHTQKQLKPLEKQPNRTLFFFPTGTLNFPLLPPLPCLPAAPSSSFLPLFLHLGLLSLDPNQDPIEGYSAKALALTAPHLFN